MNGSHIRQTLYAILAITGLIWTQLLLVDYLEWQLGEASIASFLKFSLLDFFVSGFANPAAAFLSVDAIIGGTAFLIWMIHEARKLGMRHWWVYIVLTLGVAFAFGFPAFLLMRERKLQELKPA